MVHGNDLADSLFADGYRDNRQADRIAFRLPIRASIYDASQGEDGPLHVCHVLAHDLSGGGVSLIAARRLKEGQRVELEMPDRLRTATICRVASMSDGHYLIGCRFIDGQSGPAQC